MNNQTTQMISLSMNNQFQITTENYREQLDVSFISAIDNRIVDNYCLDDMIDFINEHGADNFYNYYEQYVEIGEEYSYDAVDAFLENFDCSDLESFQDAYVGSASSNAEFAEQWYNDMGYEIPSFVVVDWDQTYDVHIAGNICCINNHYFFTSW